MNNYKDKTMYENDYKHSNFELTSGDKNLLRNSYINALKGKLHEAINKLNTGEFIVNTASAAKFQAELSNLCDKIIYFS